VSGPRIDAPADEVHGGCLCRDVRYRARTAAARTMVCHCHACQKQAGSAFSILFVIARDAIEITGAMAVFEHLGDSGQAVQRHFCGRCGSPIISTLAARPAIVAVKAGTLDDPGWLAPRLHVWCASAQPWVDIPDTAARHARAPN
jgi:hypothetical protein